MDSLNNQKAVNSHHSKVSAVSPQAHWPSPILNSVIPFKVVTETQNIKTSSSSNQGATASLRGNQSDLKDTNFEYEDNEWDIGKRSPTAIIPLGMLQ